MSRPHGGPGTWPHNPGSDDNVSLEFEKTLYAGKVESEANRQEWERSEKTRVATEEAAIALADHEWDLTEKTRLAAEDAARDAAGWAAEYALEKAVHDARIEVAKGAIERSQAGAEFIRNAAAGIATLYTGILTLAFGAADKVIAAPARAIVPALFLGISLVAASAYVAFLTRGASVAPPSPHASLRVYQERRLNKFVGWVASYTYQRAYALHAAVISLAFGVAYLPMPFIKVKGAIVIGLSVAALLIAVLLPFATIPRQPNDSQGVGGQAGGGSGSP